ncbi:MAG: DMT family transporter [Paracoccaceae bacterium]
MTTPSNQPIPGVLWMLLTGLLFVAVTAIVKHVGSALPPAEAVFIRYVLGLVFLIPMLGPIRRAKLNREAVLFFSLRGLFHTLAVILWFYAMAIIPLAEVTAMGYMTPIYITLGAAVFLGEKLAFRRLLAVLAAVVGALIILRPGFREMSSGHFAMLIASILFGGSYLVTKRMADRFSAAVVVGMLSITLSIGLAPFAAAVWITPTLDQIGWMFLVACFATAGHFTMTLAFAAAPVTVTQPVTFLQLVWAVTLGAVMFGEPVDGWVVLGGVVIFTAVTFIAWREAVLKRRGLRPQ